MDYWKERKRTSPNGRLTDGVISSAMKPLLHLEYTTRYSPFQTYTRIAFTPARVKALRAYSASLRPSG